MGMLIKANNSKRAVGFVACVLVALLSAACGDKDYVLVVDTSGSMEVGDQKLQAIKDSVPGLLEKVGSGDRVTVMNFDSKVHDTTTYDINSDADKQMVADQINGLKAKGAYTEMPAMITALKEQLKVLAPEDKTPVVMLMTDGIDDPRGKRKKLDMEQFRDPEADSDAPEPYIYYVSLGKLKDPNLEKQLEALSGKVKTVDRSQANAGGTQGADGATGDEVGLGEIAETAEDDIAEDNLMKYGLWALAALAGLALLGLLIWLLIKFITRNKLIGQLNYYEAEINFPNKATFRLDKLNKNSVKIGPKLGVDLRIKQLGIQKEFKFKTKVKKDTTYLKPVGKAASMIEYRKQTEPGLVGNGDAFKIGNFVFEYQDGKES